MNYSIVRYCASIAACSAMALGVSLPSYAQQTEQNVRNRTTAQERTEQSARGDRDTDLSSDRDADRLRDERAEQGGELQSSRDNQVPRRDRQTGNDTGQDREGNVYRTQEENVYRTQEDDAQSRQRNDDARPAGLGIVMMQDGNRAVRVRQVVPGSPAESAGLRANDRIVQVNGQSIGSTEQLIAVIRNMNPGSQVQLLIDRSGQQQTLVAQLAARSEALNQQERYGVSDREFRNYDGRYDSQFDTPQGPDDLMQYVRFLESEIDRLARDVDQLKSMLQSNPSAASGSLREESTTTFRVDPNPAPPELREDQR